MERLRADSAFDANVTAELRGKRYFADENHATYLVSFRNVRNAWARDLIALHKRDRGAFDRPAGYWESHGRHVEPHSLYLKQREDRWGKEALQPPD